MKIAQDKRKHFFAGVVIGAVLQAFFSFVLDHHLIYSLFLSIIFSFAIGYGFELFSKFTGKGHYEFLDAVAVLLGSIPGIGIVFLIQLL